MKTEAESAGATHSQEEPVSAGSGPAPQSGEFSTPLPVIRPGRYRHFKGNAYEVLCVARHSESLEPMVVYRALYGGHGVWVRPAAMWNETVERDGAVFPRFTYIGDEEGQL